MRTTPSIISSILLLIAAGTTQAGDVSGSWTYLGPAHSGLWLKTQQTGERVHFQLEIARGEPSYNSGWIEGEINLIGTNGIFRSNEDSACEISFKFNSASVQIKETPERQNCGFGYNVHADGTLRRKSGETPKFSDGDPRFGSK